MKISKEIYNRKTFITPTSKPIKGNFIFDLTRSKLQKKNFKKVCKVIIVSLSGT